MTPTALAWSVLLWTLATATLVGILARGRWRASIVLPIYLLAVCLNKPPMWFWPERFYTWGYWLATEVVEAGLYLALAVELLLLVFGRLPVGRRHAGLITVFVLGGAALTLALAPEPTSRNVDEFYAMAASRAGQATLVAGWLFAALLGLSVYYRVPLDRLHRDVAAGLALWAVIQAFPELVAPLDPYLGLGRQGMRRIVAAGFFLSWALAAWRPSEATPLDRRVLGFLQPWRAA